MVNDGSRLHANTVKTHRISLERMQESHTLQALLEVYAASPLLSTKADESYSPSEIYQILAPYSAGDERSIEDFFPESWRKAQLNGTCSMRCLLAYLNQLLDNPAAYKRLLDGMKEDSIAFAIEQYKPLLGSSPMTRKLLSTALPIVLDTLGKRAGDETLATEEELSTRGARLTEVAAKLREALPPLESTKTPLPSHDITAKIINPAQRRQWNKFVPMAEINSAAAAGPAPQPFEPIAAERVADPKDLIKALDELDAYVADLEGKKVCATAYLETSLCAIGRIFIDSANASLASKTLLEALKADPASCQRIIGQVEGLSMRLFAASRTPDALAVNPGVPIALRYALATAYELAILAETHSDYAGLQSIESYNPFFWDTFWKSDEPFLSAKCVV